MLQLRRLWAVLVGAWVAAWGARILLDWILGLEGTWVLIAIIAAAVLGGVAAIGEAKKIEPMPEPERRDAILGWTALIGFVAAASCLLLPMPWGLIAAVAVVVLTIVTLRSVARATPPPATSG